MRAGSEPPGARALRRYLRAHRPLLPVAHRWSLVIGLALVAAYGCVQVALQWIDPALARGLWQLLVLTMVAGREPALFAAYQGSPPVPVAWAVVMATIDDLATLFLAAPLAWLAMQRLRRLAAFDALLRSFEHALNDHRAAVDRWGTLALAGFLWLPGWGTGPSMSVAMGVLAGLPTRRLLLVLTASCTAVSTFWAVTLAGAAEATPDRGWWQFLPLIVIAVLVALAVATSLRQRQRRFTLEYPVPAGGDLRQNARLAAWGFEERRGRLLLDARALAAAGGPSPRRLSLSHWAGELLLLPSMTPPWAGRLAALGVTGIRDLALLPAPMLRQALGVSGPNTPPLDAPIEAWLEEARAFRFAA